MQGGLSPLLSKNKRERSESSHREEALRQGKGE
jgi:hypothetical protein